MAPWVLLRKARRADRLQACDLVIFLVGVPPESVVEITVSNAVFSALSTRSVNSSRVRSVVLCSCHLRLPPFVKQGAEGASLKNSCTSPLRRSRRLRISPLQDRDPLLDQKPSHVLGLELIGKAERSQAPATPLGRAMVISSSCRAWRSSV